MPPYANRGQRTTCMWHGPGDQTQVISYDKRLYPRSHLTNALLISFFLFFWQLLNFIQEAIVSLISPNFWLYFFIIIITILLHLFIYCVWYTCPSMCIWRSEDSGSQFSLDTVWVLGTEVRQVDLATSAFTHWSSSVILVFFSKCLMMD